MWENIRYDKKEPVVVGLAVETGRSLAHQLAALLVLF